MLSKWLKIGLAIIYVPLAIEGLLRVLAPEPIMPRYVTAAPYGVRCNQPNQTYRHKTAEYAILIQTNSRGIRTDHEIPYEKPPDRKRVVLLGDSFGMGYGVDAKEMFISRMANYLKTEYGHDVEVVNLSTSGHGNAEELITLQNEGLKYHPDLVILAWHYTDLDDNVRSDLYELTTGGLQRKANSYLPGVKEREFLNKFTVYRFLAENTQIYNFCRNWGSRKVKQLLVKARFKKSQSKQNSEPNNINIKKKYVKELTVALLEEIERQCRENKSHFLILDIPFKVSRKEFVSRFPVEYLIDTNSLHVVSPIEKFKEKSGKQLYWEKGDGHFTPLGCELVGNMMAEYIQRCNLIEPFGHD